MGSSQLVEFLVALVVGLLAVLASLLCISFLLVEPIKSPPSQEPTVSLADLFASEGCAVASRQEQLPQGCTHEDSPLVSVGHCSMQECPCDQQLLAQGSLCCCRPTSHAPLEGVVCPRDTMLTGMTNVTACGCTACDDIEMTVSLTVQAMRSNDPIAAAQVYRVTSEGDLMLVGITNNLGRFHVRELAATRSVVFRVQAPGYVPQVTPPFNLRPDAASLGHTVVLMPSMDIPCGMGDSPLELQLGDILTLRTPANCFTSMDGEPYGDMVMFNGGVVNVMDEYEVATIPSSTFAYLDPVTGEEMGFGALVGIFIQFTDRSGMPLQCADLEVSVVVSAPNDGNMPELFFVEFNPLSGWVRGEDLVASEPAKRKRQTTTNSPISFDGRGNSIGFFSVVASLNGIQCFLQARVFASDGVTPVTDSIVTVQQTAIVTNPPDSTTFFQFIGETNQFQSSVDGLVTNALCLPVACNNVVPGTGTLMATDLDPQPGIDTRIAIDFDSSVFGPNEPTPFTLGTVFLFEEAVQSTADEPRPFYQNSDDCIAAGAIENGIADASNYFTFHMLDAAPATPTETDTCFIKIQIRACFTSNMVTVTSLVPASTEQRDRQTIIVGEPEDPPTTMAPTTGMPTTEDVTDIETTTFSGDGPTTDFETPDPFTTTDIPTTDPPTTDMPTTDTPTTAGPTEPLVCNATTATIRAACVPYVCGSDIDLIVAASPENPDLTGFCSVTSRSVQLSTSFFSSSGLLRLSTTTGDLLVEDFNNPDLGLYTDAGTTLMAADFAEQRCNAGLGEDQFSPILDVNTGIAATFSCFEE